MRATAVVALALMLALSAPAAGAPRLPAGFSDERVTRVFAPTALAFTPGGDLLIATKAGRLLLRGQNGAQPRRVLDLRRRVCTRRHDGLSGVTVDPEFDQNRFVYLYFTRARGRCGSRAVNRLSRFVLAPGGVDPRSERVLLDKIPSPAGFHQAGDLHFGNDRFLYVSVGDGYCHYAGGGRCRERNGAAREDHVLLGKILRIDRDGLPAAGNDGGVSCARAGRTRPGARCAEIFAKGLRNPFRMAFDPNSPDTRFFINDVGNYAWEEVDEGRQGADYGWNLREGRCRAGSRRAGSRAVCGPPAPPGLTDPIHAYSHRSGCQAITGGAFVPQGVWPEPFWGDYLFADYICGKIFRLEQGADGGYVARTFATGFGGFGMVHILFGPGPHGMSLYYTTFVNGGEVRRISYIAATGALSLPGPRRQPP